MQDNALHTPQPLISFIVPYHNEPFHMVEACVASILKTETHAEIVVVDDGSTSNLHDRLTAISPAIKYLRHDTSRGLSAARNTGMKTARGEYIQFVDSDDTLCPDAYKQIITLAATNPDADIIQFNHPHWKRYTPFPPQFRHTLLFDGSGTDYMCRHNLRAAAWSYLFKRDLLGDLRFTDTILHEDEDFTPRLILRAHRMLTTTIHAYNYTHRLGTITTRRTTEWTTRRLNDIEAIIVRMAQTAATLTHDKRKALTRRTNQLTMNYIYQTMRLTRSITETQARINSLRSHQLYPLPIRTYTMEYFLASILSHIIR